VLLSMGVPLSLVGLGVTGLLVSGGAWTMGHMYPLLWVSVPMLVIGVIFLTIFVFVRKN
jgi:hypothetical protein